MILCVVYAGKVTEEDVDHTLRSCSYAQAVWYASPLRLNFSRENMSFKDWVLHMLSKRFDVEWWSLFWALAWQCWFSRNRWVFEKRRR